MEKSAQFEKNPVVGMTLSYREPEFNEKGGMRTGHMVTANAGDGTPLGFVEWGHKLTPHGNSAVMGESLGQHQTQENISHVFDKLWDAAGKHAERTGTSATLNRAKGRSTYLPPVAYDAQGRVM